MCIELKYVRWILLWNLFTTVGYVFSIHASNYLLIDMDVMHDGLGTVAEAGFFALVFLLSPLSGWVGDVKCGRFRTIQGGVLLVMMMSLIPLAVGTLLFKYPLPLVHSSGAKAAILVVLICFVMIGIAGYTAFLANIIPFSMDQLRDSPSQELIMTIYWYV